MNKAGRIAASLRLGAAPAVALILLSACATSEAPPPSAWQSGQKQMQTGQWSEARRSFERELREHPNNQKARYNLALLLAQNGHNDDAATLYRENLKIRWHFPSAINLARLLQASGNSDAAIDLLTRTTRESPHEATPWYLLAEIADTQGKPVLADQHYRQALKADPANGYAHLRYAAFQSRQALADHGLDEGKKASQLLPECAACWRQYGDILLESGEHDPARAAYQRSLAIQPSWQTRQKLIDLLYKEGQTEQGNRMQKALDAWKKLHMDSREQ
jgi:Tfp pilus assembly protein PilF